MEVGVSETMEKLACCQNRHTPQVSEEGSLGMSDSPVSTSEGSGDGLQILLKDGLVASVSEIEACG